MRSAALLLAAALAAPLAAQTSRLRADIELDGVAISSAPAIGSVNSYLSGSTFGGAGRLALGPVRLDLGYWQGSLTTQSGPAANEDVVEGQALLGIAPVRWLTLSGGPAARAYTTPGGTERWFTWRVQARVDEPLVEGVVSGYGEMWIVAATSVNVVQPFSSGRGGTFGLRVTPPRWPIWLTMGYGIEQIKLGDGSRLDTVNRVSFGVGYSRR